MAKFVSPQLGYNNNVRHRGRVFHVQTEDSGINHPHIITHLFMDGGRILKSVKKSYAEHIGSDTLKETVKTLMKEQHKAMFIALRDGQFDELFEPKEAKKPSDANVQKVSVPEPPITQPELPPTSDREPEPKAEAAPPASVEEAAPHTIDENRRVPAIMPPLPPAPPASEPFALEAAPNTVPEVRRSVVPPPPQQLADVRPAAAASAERRPSAAELTLDFDALERDAGAGISPMFQSGNDLPPPPKNLFAKERGTGAYSTINEVEPHSSDPRREEASSPRPAQRPSLTPRNPSRPPPSHRGDGPAAKGENGRYTATRPATIFGSTIKPSAPTSSIFGDELVSDKSLDEVILSYLAEDLEPRK